MEIIIIAEIIVRISDNNGSKIYKIPYNSDSVEIKQHLYDFARKYIFKTIPMGAMEILQIQKVIPYQLKIRGAVKTKKRYLTHE